MSAEQQRNEPAEGARDATQTPDVDSSTLEQQIHEEYSGLAGAGRFVYDRAMQYAAKKQYDIAISSCVEDMNHLGRTVGFDNFKKLKSRTHDIGQFQLCLLGVIREAKFH